VNAYDIYINLTIAGKTPSGMLAVDEFHNAFVYLSIVMKNILSPHVVIVCVYNSNYFYVFFSSSESTQVYVKVEKKTRLVVFIDHNFKYCIMPKWIKNPIRKLASITLFVEKSHV
jgi:hypothetical protein